MNNLQIIDRNDGELPARRQLITRYIYQLGIDCGNLCSSNDCRASSQNVRAMTKAELSSKAFQFMANNAEFCATIGNHLVKFSYTFNGNSAKDSAGYSDCSSSLDSLSCTQTASSRVSPFLSRYESPYKLFSVSSHELPDVSFALSFTPEFISLITSKVYKPITLSSLTVSLSHRLLLRYTPFVRQFVSASQYSSSLLHTPSTSASPSISPTASSAAFPVALSAAFSTVSVFTPPNMLQFIQDVVSLITAEVSPVITTTAFLALPPMVSSVLPFNASLDFSNLSFNSFAIPDNNLQNFNHLSHYLFSEAGLFNISVANNDTNYNLMATMDNANFFKDDEHEPKPWRYTINLEHIGYLNEAIMDELIDGWLQFRDFQTLVHAINKVFPSIEKLSHSFRCETVTTKFCTSDQNQSEFIYSLFKKSHADNGSALEVECSNYNYSSIKEYISKNRSSNDSAIVEMEKSTSNSHFTDLDFESLRRIKARLHGLNSAIVFDTIVDNITELCENIRNGRLHDWEQVVHCLLIGFDFLTTDGNRIADFEYVEHCLPKLSLAACVLPTWAQARMARIWSHYYREKLRRFILSCHQLITLLVLIEEDAVQNDPNVLAVVRILKIAFYANLLAGELDTLALRQESMNLIGQSTLSNVIKGEDNSPFITLDYNGVAYTDSLEKELGVSVLSCRVPIVPFEEFYNEPLSDALQIECDYISYRSLLMDPFKGNCFSYMFYSFVLTPPTKVLALYYDSRIRQEGGTYPPNLHLKVRRDHIVNDALFALEMVLMSNPKDLKKQLIVEFVGEEGIDEGGVSKEFFQLVIEGIFNPDFGMFVIMPHTNAFWFNLNPLENDAQYTLIGIIVGLAIYNNITLGLRFPLVMYRKLIGGCGTFYDMNDFNPVLYRSLKTLLDYKSNDIEDVFMQTFRISYTNAFREVLNYDLKPKGYEIFVGQHNKLEFIQMYSDYLLNKIIEKQFVAFKKGFDMILEGSPLKMLFRTDEVELLFCGCVKLDFLELERVTEYEGGYTKDSQTIMDFWSVVHSLPDQLKRKLLEFTTGSDRVPVGGLSRLRLVINRNGSDSDRLPASHTCFNVLLLPEYSNKQKLEERLLKAINYSKGFGML